MSDWKNPSFGKRDDASDWTPPFIDHYADEQNKLSNISLGMFVRAVFGFAVVVGINALALFAVAYFLDFSLPYRSATIVAGIYVMWRVYDQQVFDKLRR